MTQIVAITGNLLALLIYGEGLIAPLTPSEGTPSLLAILAFVGLPLFLLLHAWRIYRSIPAKIVIVLQIIGVVGFTAWLLLSVEFLH